MARTWEQTGSELGASWSEGSETNVILGFRVPTTIGLRKPPAGSPCSQLAPLAPRASLGPWSLWEARGYGQGWSKLKLACLPPSTLPFLQLTPSSLQPPSSLPACSSSLPSLKLAPSSLQLTPLTPACSPHSSSLPACSSSLQLSPSSLPSLQLAPSLLQLAPACSPHSSSLPARSSTLPSLQLTPAHSPHSS